MAFDKKEWAKANAPKMRSYRRKWEKAHPRKRTGYRDRRAYSRQWAGRNPAKIEAQAKAAYARRKGAGGRGVTTEEWQETRDGYCGLCAYCGQPRKATMDHVDPIAKGGRHEPENVAPACARCNRSKSSKTLVIWLAQRAA